jgi:single-strand DNA-binding protein
MANFNRVTLLGNLTRDPHVRYTPSGTAVASFGLAVNRRVRQGTETKEEVCYVDITAFGPQAEAIGEYLTKGAAALIDGRLRWHQWEKDGQRHSKLDVVADSVQFLTRREASAVPADGDDLAGGDDPEDDIPF